MITLYIDCDGVILDTITTTYKMIEDSKIDLNNQVAIRKFYRELDWDYILKITSVLNDAYNAIKNIQATKLYDVKILTHVNSDNEGIKKRELFKKELPNIEVITVKREIEKCDAINPKDTILVDDFSGNLDLWDKKGGIAVKYSNNDKESQYIKINNLNELIALYKTFEEQISKNKTRTLC